MAKNVSLASVDQKLAMAKRCSHGAKAAVVASVATAIPTMVPWARANLNPTAKALIVSTAAGMTYFVVTRLFWQLQGKTPSNRAKADKHKLF